MRYRFESNYANSVRSTSYPEAGEPATVNVIVINDNAQVNGGAAKVAIQEAAGLAERGHRVYFVCAVAPVAPELVHENITVLCSHQHDLLSNPNPLQAFVQGWWNHRAAHLTRGLLGCSVLRIRSFICIRGRELFLPV